MLKKFKGYDMRAVIGLFLGFVLRQVATLQKKLTAEN